MTDIDPKGFFDDAPRMNHDVRVSVHERCEEIVTAVFTTCDRLGCSPIQPKHVKAAIFVLSVDPITTYARGQLAQQSSKLKHMMRLLCKTVDESIARVADGDKTGRVDKRIIKLVKALVKRDEWNASPSGIVAVAAIVAPLGGTPVPGLRHTTEHGTSKSRLNRSSWCQVGPIGAWRHGSHQKRPRCCRRLSDPGRLGASWESLEDVV